MFCFESFSCVFNLIFFWIIFLLYFKTIFLFTCNENSLQVSSFIDSKSIFPLIFLFNSVNLLFVICYFGPFFVFCLIYDLKNKVYHINHLETFSFLYNFEFSIFQNLYLFCFFSFVNLILNRIFKVLDSCIF